MLSVVLVAALALQQQQAHSSAPIRLGPTPSAEALASDTGSLRHPNGRVPPVVGAVRASAGSPRIDARLDDAVWALAAPVTQFTQRNPRDGAAPSESTEVRVAFDDEAVYIGARMYDSEPALIAAQLGRRDALGSSDFFEVDFDSYHDHLTSFQFYVNPAGVKLDLTATNDFSGGDAGWDPVWDVATQRDSLGWTAEMRIPLSQLRFPNVPTQVWGMNFYRYIHRRGESDWWAYVGQTDNGYASQFGHVLGLRDLPQPRRFEVMPYAAGVEERLASGRADNPFNDGSREVGRVGLDVKYGLTSNLTLDATVNPDFGQVEGDPAVINLSAYETYLGERRPFFIEGAGIFSLVSPGIVPVSGPQLLYSRRIGRAPQASAVARGSDGFTDSPSSTTILGAAKLTGRLAGGWSLGLLEAVTAREYASVDSAGARFRDEVEPLTNYSALRGMRDFGNGATTLGFMGTAVNRRIDNPRLDFLRSAAYAGGVDVAHRFARNRYIAYAALAYSRIEGDTLAIQAAQLSSARYFQRPDAGHVSYDGARTALTGWNAAFGLSKERGTTLYAAGASITSPGFEINDLGWQSRSDRAYLYLRAGRRWNQPGRLFRSANVSSFATFGWNLDGDRVSTNANASAYGQFTNFWSVNSSVSASTRVTSDALTRGGPLGVGLAQVSGNLCFTSDSRKPLSVHAGSNFALKEMGGGGWGFHVETAWRPSPTIQLSQYTSYYGSREAVQYVTSRADETATAMFGRRYLFAQITQRSLDLTTRLNVTLTTTLSLQLYVQPFVATGDYRRFKELTTPGTADYLVFGETPGSTVRDSLGAEGQVLGHTVDPDGAGPRPSTWLRNPDFNSRSLRGNAVLRWEYRPGSTLFLVWTQSCSAYTPNAAFDATGDLGRLCQGRSNNVFAVKANYWLSL